MLIKRNASAQWNGAGKTGHGTLSTDSTVLHETAYSFITRFTDEIGTNPEELLAAAHAGCFSMKLAFVLNAAGVVAEQIDTKAQIVLEDAGITNVYLTTRVKADMDADKFAECAADAKANCPVSKLFKAEIHLDAELL